MGAALTASIGDELPTFERTTAFEHWNRFAAVNYEFVPIHMDDEAGRQAGHAGAIGMGNLLLAYLHNLLRNWLGEDGRITKIGCQFRSPNFKGQTLIARGVVQDVTEDGDHKDIALDIWLEDTAGTKLVPGTATVRVG